MGGIIFASAKSMDCLSGPAARITIHRKTAASSGARKRKIAEMDFGHINSSNILRALIRVGCAALICIAAGGNGIAQELERENTVADRHRPGLDAEGMPLGGFRLFPAVGLGLVHKDNVFATEAEEQSDTVIMVRPELELVSESSRHEATIGAEAELARYNDFDGEDYDDLDVYADGHLVLGNGRLQAELRHSDLHEDRTSADDARGIEPTQFTIDKVAGAYSWKPGRWMTTFDAGYRKFEFDDTAALIVPIDNADRDRDVTELGLRLAREMSPSYALYAEAKAKQIEYEQQFDRNGFERSSDGFSAVVGSLMDFSGQTFGEVFAGYLERKYDDPRYGTADGPTFGARVTWNVTGLTTLIFIGSRGIDSTTVAGAAGIDTTEFGFAANHELLRNLILNLDLSFANEDFDGIDRDDDITRAMVGGKYFMNRYLNLEFGYAYHDRSTSPANTGAREFEINQFFVHLVGQL